MYYSRFESPLTHGAGYKVLKKKKKKTEIRRNEFLEQTVSTLREFSRKPYCLLHGHLYY
jgi:hypothetical protein